MDHKSIYVESFNMTAHPENGYSITMTVRGTNKDIVELVNFIHTNEKIFEHIEHKDAVKCSVCLADAIGSVGGKAPQ
jgi:hypothetical protein